MRSLRFGLTLITTALFLAATARVASAGNMPDGHSNYLALGDSVVFGFITQAGFEYINPDNFNGYPFYIGLAQPLNAVDAACPGETSGSLLSPTAPDNGCRAFRAQFPLHVLYPSTQIAFATSFLDAHRGTRLVTLGVGANDVFILRDQCAGDPQCIAAGLPQVLATVNFNVQTILRDLRATGYRGVILVVNYYSLDYSDAVETGIVQALNQALAAAAFDQGASVADVFTAFRLVASNPFAGGNTCKAALLNALPQNQFLCDVHPSQSGQRLIAKTVEQAFRTAMKEGD